MIRCGPGRSHHRTRWWRGLAPNYGCIMSLENLIASLRTIGPHVILTRLPGAGNYSVDAGAARVVRLHEKAFNQTPLQGISGLPSLAEWLEGAGYHLFDSDNVRADRVADTLECFAAGEHQTPTELVLSPTDFQILEYLANARTTVSQYELDAHCIVSRRAASPQLNRLRDAGLVYRPNGPRGGEAITPAGRKMIAHSLPPLCPQAPQKKERIRP